MGIAERRACQKWSTCWSRQMLVIMRVWAGSKIYKKQVQSVLCVVMGSPGAPADACARREGAAELDDGARASGLAQGKDVGLHQLPWHPGNQVHVRCCALYAPGMTLAARPNAFCHRKPLQRSGEQHGEARCAFES